ncbi:MAG: 50S ribosomal protein L30 [Candidatus Lokiarchaeota archaeon]|nr:50S ribosomal protein L30 [Candidatus Lokiarchaeota archaeon]
MAKEKGSTKTENKLMLVIRVRGAPHMNYKIHDTLKMLRLNKVNHASLVFADKSMMGMLRRAKDYIAYGEVDKETVLKLLNNRALVKGNLPLTDKHIKKHSKFTSVKAFADALISGEVKLNDINELKPVFRLHPPIGGHRGTVKKHYHAGGTLGHVGEFINVLASKMI